MNRIEIHLNEKKNENELTQHAKKNGTVLRTIHNTFSRTRRVFYDYLVRQSVTRNVLTTASRPHTLKKPRSTKLQPSVANYMIIPINYYDFEKNTWENRTGKKYKSDA